MIFFGVVFGFILMASMTYMAVNKKSITSIRIACLVALAIMVLTTIICLFIVLTDNRVPVDESVLIVGAPVEVKKNISTNITALIALTLVLLGMFVFIVIYSMRENRKQTQKDSTSSDKSIYNKFDSFDF